MYTGLIDLLEDDTLLSAVLAHEIRLGMSLTLRYRYAYVLGIYLQSRCAETRRRERECVHWPINTVSNHPFIGWGDCNIAV